MPNEIPVVFYNGSNYDYHSNMKELEDEFKVKFDCLVENTEKYENFSVPIEKEIKKIDKDSNEDIKTVSYKINLLIVQIYDKFIIKPS